MIRKVVNTKGPVVKNWPYQSWNTSGTVQKSLTNKKLKHGGVYVSRPNGALGVPIWESSDVTRIWDHQYRYSWYKCMQCVTRCYNC